MNQLVENAMHEYQLHLTPHIKGKTLKDHLEDVSEILISWGESESVCQAGLLHSIYGRAVTIFKPVSLEVRSQIKDLIGEPAEQLVYLNCAMTPYSFWMNFLKTSDYKIFDRFLKSNISIERSQLLNLLTINTANLLDHLVHDVKSPELSLFLQNYDYLPLPAKKSFTEIIGIYEN